MKLQKHILISILIHFAAALFFFTTAINDGYYLNMKNGRTARSDGDNNSKDGSNNDMPGSLKQIVVEFFSSRDKTAGADKIQSGRSSSPDAGALNRMAADAYKNSPPEYPYIAKKMGYQGVVSLDLEILPDGRCGSVMIAKSSGYPVLDSAAVNAARNWIFFKNYSVLISSPARVRQDIRFVLNSY